MAVFGGDEVVLIHNYLNGKDIEMNRMELDEDKRQINKVNTIGIKCCECRGWILGPNIF